MEKDAALLVIAKDLFLEGWNLKSVKIPANIKADGELDYFAEEFLSFLKKLQSSIGN